MQQWFFLSRTPALPVPDSCKPASGHLDKFSNVIIQQTSFNKFCVPHYNYNRSCLQPVPYLTTHLHISHCWLVLSSRADGSRKAEFILTVVFNPYRRSVSFDPLYSNDMSLKAEDCSLIHRRAVDQHATFIFQTNFDCYYRTRVKEILRAIHEVAEEARTKRGGLKILCFHAVQFRI